MKLVLVLFAALSLTAFAQDLRPGNERELLGGFLLNTFCLVANAFGIILPLCGPPPPACCIIQTGPNLFCNEGPECQGGGCTCYSASTFVSTNPDECAAATACNQG